ncbi:MAG: hypothetical protein ABIZ05_10355 [Pseudonocardiaceae bacterium]
MLVEFNGFRLGDAHREGELTTLLAARRSVVEAADVLVDSRDLKASFFLAARVARKVGVEEMQPVDLIICGSVAALSAGH